jgi:hypothetical protein
VLRFCFVGGARVLLVAALAACGTEDRPPLPGIGGGGSSSSASSGGGGPPGQLENAQLGNPQLVSAQTIGFGPGGLLFVGDGWSDRVVAIETGDTDIATRPANVIDEVPNLMARLANAFGPDVPSGEVNLLDVAVNPVTWRVYLAVQRFTTAEVAILWLDGDGEAHRFSLDDVIYASVSYPPIIGAPGSYVTGIAATADMVVALTGKGAFQPGQIVLVDLPFRHDGPSRTVTTRIYHPTHFQWESGGSIDRGLLYFTLPNGSARGGPPGEPHLAAAYSDTPVVRFPLSSLERGGEVTGVTAFDIGGGRLVQSLGFDDRSASGSLIVSIYNLTFDGGWSVARIDRSLLTETVAVDEQARLLFGFDGTPQVNGVDRLYFLDGATQLELIEQGRAVIVRGDVLETVNLPD